MKNKYNYQNINENVIINDNMNINNIITKKELYHNSNNNNNNKLFSNLKQHRQNKNRMSMDFDYKFNTNRFNNNIK